MFSIFSLIAIVAFLWFIRTIKAVLFWLYLWQLKNYHIGRFVDHFRTHAGKKIFANGLFGVKLIMLALLLAGYEFFNLVFYMLIAVYVAECVLFLHRGAKKPVWTLKMKILGAVSFGVMAVFLIIASRLVTSDFWFIFTVLAFDIFVPIIVTGVVLAWQPLFVGVRNKVLQKATEKMQTFKDVKVIAVTGSYGKTTTKEFLTTILSSKFNVLATPDHKNSEMGIAETILGDLNHRHQIFIVEMGAYNKGGIKLLCDMVKPTMGIVAGVNEQHLATFGSLENLLSAEGGQELAESLPTEGLLAVNGDNQYCIQLYKNFNGHKKIYSARENSLSADMWAEHLEVGEESLDFVAITKQKEVAHVTINVLGGHNIQNILGAILIAHELGMSMGEIAEACKNIRATQAGITMVRGQNGIIIDSSYSSNPDGVMADLDYLNVFTEKKIVVMPCLIELGSSSTRVHEQIGKKMAQVCDVAIITTKDKFKELAQGFMSQGLSERKILLCENPHEIFKIITTLCSEDDVVLLEGRVPGELMRLLKG